LFLPSWRVLFFFKEKESGGREDGAIKDKEDTDVLVFGE